MKKKKKQKFQQLADRFRGEGVTPACRHFGTCGGCLFQDIAYENQLELKKAYLNELLEGIIQLDEVKGSEPLGYRNRMDMVSAFGKVGLRERGSYKFVCDLAECPLMQQKSEAVFKEIIPLMKEVEGYNYLSHKGYLRYAVLRQGYFTGQVMVNLVTKTEEDNLDNITAYLTEQVNSTSQLLSDGLADLSTGPVIKNWKAGYIEEDFDGIRYRITPNSFFQSNSPVAREMYRRIKEEIQGKVLDLYSGVGSISLYIAEKAESVTGVELNSEAVDTANINREINGIENVSFICEDARVHMREEEGTYDTLVMDPPRSGIHPKMRKSVMEMAPERIVYMSCNPATFRDDVLELTDYKLVSFEAWDMFPQTPHIETLAVLQRK